MDKASPSVLVAYTSKRSARSDRSGPELQTFVLGMPTTWDWSNILIYPFHANINGRFVQIESSALKLGQWAHIGCSLHNVYALQFSGSNYVDVGSGAEFNLSDFTLTFTLKLDEVGRGEQILFTKSASGNSPSPFTLKLVGAGKLALTYWAEGGEGEAATERTFEMSTGPTNMEGKPLAANVPYKFFLSRKFVHVPRKDQAPRPFQLFTLCVWWTNGIMAYCHNPPTVDVLKEQVETLNYYTYRFTCQNHGPAQGN